MKTHTNNFKQQIKLIGKEIDSKITFGDTVLGKNELNAVTPLFQGAILKSAMKQLVIDSNIEIPIGTFLKYEFGLKVDANYEYIDFGNYVVKEIEKKEDTNSFEITCFDKMLFTMKEYKQLGTGGFPMTVRDYITKVCLDCGLLFIDTNKEFANYDKIIESDLYANLGYTYRDVLDELAQVTASTICLNKNDSVEIRYITETNDTIDEEFLKDVNVNFGEKFGAVNTIVLSRSAESDSIYYPEILPENPYELKISDNQIMNGNDRADYLPDIYDKLNGLEFYTNDFVSTGICYYDLCDRYSVKVRDKNYSCVMFNDEIFVTQGLQENIYTELPIQTETDYKKSDTDDRRINQAYLILNKQEKTLEGVLSEQTAQGERVAKIEGDTSSLKLSVSETNTALEELNPIDESNGTELTLKNSAGLNTVDFTIDGNYHQETRSGKNLFNYEDTTTVTSGVTADEDGWITITGDNTSGTSTLFMNYWTKNLDLKFNTTYKAILEIKSVSGTGGLVAVDDSSASQFSNYLKIDDFTKVKAGDILIQDVLTKSSFDTLDRGLRSYGYFSSGQSGSITFRISVLEDTSITADTFEYEAYGAMPSPDYPSEVEVVEGYNLANITSVSGGYNQTLDNEVVTVNGNNNSASNLVINLNNEKAKLKQNATYTISVVCDGIIESSSYKVCYLGIKNKSSINIGSLGSNKTLTYKYTPTEDVEITFISFDLSSNTTFTDYRVKIQIKKGASKPYLPYQNIGIENVGKNLFNGKLFNNATKSGVTWTVQDDGGVKVTGTSISSGNAPNSIGGWTSTTPIIELDPNKTYTISFSGNFDTTKVQFEGRGLYNGTPTTFATSLSKPFTITGYSCLTYFNIYAKIGATDMNETVYILVEESDFATDCEEYRETITPLDLKGEFIGKLPNGTEDYLTVDNQGNYGIQKNIGKIVLDGSESWLKQNTNHDNFVFKYNSDKFVPNGSFLSTTIPNVISNKFNKETWYNAYVSNYLNEGICTHNSNNQLMIIISKNRLADISSDETTLSSFKTWLSTHNTTVYYELAEPYYVELGKTPIKTLEGDSTMHLLSTLDTNMYCKYIRNIKSIGVFQPIGDMDNYYNKYEVDSAISVEKNNILLEVNSVKATVGTNGETLASLEKTVNLKIDDDKAQFNAINDKLEDGVEKLKNTLVTIDIEGIHVETNTSKIATLITNNTFAIKNSTEDYLAFFGYDEEEKVSKAEMDNLTVKKYFKAGSHRREVFSPDGVEQRTGEFYDGGVD